MTYTHATHCDDIQATQTITGQYLPLEQVTRPTLKTEEAAHYLNRRPQTLRVWSLTGHPIMPLRVNGRLAWPVSEIRRLLGVSA